jgi:DNA-binding transcriptional regulator YhcF (GntR family)
MEYKSYLRVANDIRNAIIAGRYSPGSRIPSVLALAKQHCLSPSTVARGISIVEEEGLLVKKRTSGRYVINDMLAIEEIRQSDIKKITMDFLQGMKSLGLENKTILHMLRKQREDCNEYHK